MSGLEAHHAKTLKLGLRNRDANKRIGIRLPYTDYKVMEKSVALEMGSFNPSGRTVGLDVKWKLNNHKGECTFIMEAAKLFGPAINERVLKNIVTPKSYLVNGEIEVKYRKKGFFLESVCDC